MVDTVNKNLTPIPGALPHNEGAPRLPHLDPPRERRPRGGAGGESGGQNGGPSEGTGTGSIAGGGPTSAGGFGCCAAMAASTASPTFCPWL